MRYLLLILGTLVCCNLFAQYSDSSNYYKNKYHIEEAKFLISENNTVEAVKHLLLALPSDTSNYNRSEYAEVLQTLHNTYYNYRSSKMEIPIPGYPSDTKFTDDGKYIGSISYITDNKTSLYIFDAATGQRVNKNLLEDFNPRHFTFSPSSSEVAVWKENRIEEWDILTEKISTMVTLTENNIFSCKYSPCGTKLYLLLDNGKMNCLHLDGTNIKQLELGSSRIRKFHLSENGERVLLDCGGTIEVWDLNSQTKISSTKGDKYHMAFSPDGNSIIVDGFRKDFVIDANTGDIKDTLNKVMRSEFSKDGDYIYGQSLEKSNTITLFYKKNLEQCISIDCNYNSIPVANSKLTQFISISTNKINVHSGLEPDMLMYHNGNILGIDISKDNSMVATCANDSTAKIWEIATGEIIGKPLLHDRKVVEKVKFSPDGKILATLSRDDNKVTLWDVKSGNALPVNILHKRDILDMDISPCGNYLATSGKDCIVKCWDVNSGNIALELKGHSAKVNAVKYSPCGKYIYSASNDANIIKWDASTGKILGRMMSSSGAGIAGIAMSNDGTILASRTYDHRIRMWDTGTGKELSGRNNEGAAHNNWIYELNFSEDGKWLASTSADSTLHVYDTSNGELVSEPFRFGGHAQSAKFIQNDSILAVSCWDCKIYFIDTKTWEIQPQTIGMKRRVQNMSLSPNKKFMATSVLFNPLNIWKIHTPAEIAEYYKETAPYNSAIEGSNIVTDPQFYKSAYFTRLASYEYKKEDFYKAKELLKNVKDDFYGAAKLKSNVFYKTDGLALNLSVKYVCCYSGCGKYLITTGDSTITVLDAKDFTKVYETNHNLKKYFPIVISTSNCGTYFALADHHSFGIYNVKDGKLVYGPFAANDFISNIKFFGKEKILIEKFDKNFRTLPMTVMDLKTQQTTEIEFINGSWSNAISDDGKYLIFSDPMNYTYLYEIGKENKLIFTGGAKGSPSIYSTISGNGKHFAYTTGKCNINTGKLSNNIVEIRDVKKQNLVMDPLMFDENIINIKLTEDGKAIYVLLSSNRDGNQRVIKYNIGNTEPIFEYTLDPTPGSSYMNLHISRDGNHISVTGTNTVVLTKYGKLAAPIYEGDTEGFSPCGNYLIHKIKGEKVDILKFKGYF